jgi:hypothetical protein
MFSNKNKKTIKFHKNSFIHKLQYLLLIFTLSILFFITQAYSYSETISASLDSKILRLHIVANSNSYQDQIFKLKCRDAIINYLNTNISPSNYTKEYITSFKTDTALKKRTLDVLDFLVARGSTMGFLLREEII